MKKSDVRVETTSVGNWFNMRLIHLPTGCMVTKAGEGSRLRTEKELFIELENLLGES